MTGRVVSTQTKEIAEQQKVFVTYDVNETGGTLKPLLYRVVKEVPISGTLTTWTIGEFKIHGVGEVYGVKLKYLSSDGSEKEDIVDTSSYAQNIQIFVGILPQEYQNILQRSA